MLTLKPVGHMSRAVDVVDRHLARGRNDGNILKDLSGTWDSWDLSKTAPATIDVKIT